MTLMETLRAEAEQEFNRMKAVIASLGGRPTREGIQIIYGINLTLIERVYGAWTKALSHETQLSDDAIRKNYPSYFKTEIQTARLDESVQQLLDLADRLGRIPSRTELVAAGLTVYQFSKLGGFSTLVKQHRSLKPGRSKTSPDTTTTEVLALADALGRHPTLEEVTASGIKPGKVHAAGGLRSILTARPNLVPAPKKKPSGRRKGTPARSRKELPPREAILDLLRDRYALTGTPMQAAELAEALGVTSATLSRRLGTLTALQTEAGLPTTTDAKRKHPEALKATRSGQRKRNKKSRKARRDERLRAMGIEPGNIGITQMAITLAISRVLGNTAYESEKLFPWLVNPETGRPLRVDAYFPDYNLAVEYQSELHFGKASKRFKRYDLSDTLYRDWLKRKLLAENGVPLVEITYLEPHTDEHLRARLTALGLL